MRIMLTSLLITSAAYTSAMAGTGDLVVDGKLGIGAAIDSRYNLLVGGAIRANSYYLDGNTYLSRGAGELISMYTNGIERLRIAGDGNIGIGTASPTEKLEVSTSGIQSHLMMKLNTANDRYAQLGYFENGFLKWNIYNDYINDNLNFGTSTGPKVAITQLGRLGIGTTNPLALLHLSDSTDANMVLEETGNSILKVKAGTNSAYLLTTTSHPISFGTNNNINLTMATTGHVGIGTMNPTHRLSIYDNSANGIILDAAAIPVQRFAIGGNEKWGFLVNHAATDAFGIYNYTRSGYDFVISPTTGFVGIGTNTPAYALDVSGTIRGNNVSPSDARLKENIKPVDSALEKVQQLEGVTFAWKKGEIGKLAPDGRHYGVIAQEIEKVLPEVVSTDPEGTKAVAYTEIIPVLIEAIKEQQKIIERQQERMERFEKSLKTILGHDHESF